MDLIGSVVDMGKLGQNVENKLMKIDAYLWVEINSIQIYTKKLNEIDT